MAEGSRDPHDWRTAARRQACCAVPVRVSWLYACSWSGAAAHAWALILRASCIDTLGLSMRRAAADEAWGGPRLDVRAWSRPWTSSVLVRIRRARLSLRGLRASQTAANNRISLSCTSYSPRERSAAAKFTSRPILLEIASPASARYGTAKKGKNKSSQIAPTSSVSSRSTWLYIVHRGAELIIFLRDEVFTFSKLRKLYRSL